MRGPTQDVTPFTFRQALQGNMDLSKLPLAVASQIRAMWRRFARQERRDTKRSGRNAAYQFHGLNGKRAVARRLRQIAAGSLRAENGLCGGTGL